MAYLPIGTILFSNNLNPQDNASPGLWNHACIIIDEQYNIVEAQMDKGVILTSFIDYKKRPYDWKTWACLYPRSRANGIKAAEYAKTLVGRRYGKLSSIRMAGRKYNCVKVVSESYGIKAAIPDDFTKYINLFTNKLEESK